MEEYKIPLRNMSGEIIDFTIVNKDDYEELINGKWFITHSGYVGGSINKFKGMMHKYLIKKYNIQELDVIDHVNSNKLDNRICNIRPASFSQNAQNKNKTKLKETTSDYIGVCKTLKDSKWHELRLFSWNVNNKEYVQRSTDCKKIHHYLMKTDKNTMVDHINGNKLDNRLSNLRVTNSSLNSHNLKETKNENVGINIRNDYKDGIVRYRAMISKDSKNFSKTTKDLQEAIDWRNEKAKELYGEYAKLN